MFIFMLFTVEQREKDGPKYADKIAEMYSKIKLLLSNKIKPITLKTELRRILFFAPMLSVIAPQGSSVIKETNQKIDK